MTSSIIMGGTLEDIFAGKNLEDIIG